MMKNTTLASILLIFATLFWAGNYIAGHFLVTSISPVLLTELRWFFTAALLLLLYHQKVYRELSFIKASLPVLFMLALAGQVLFPLNLYIGLQYTTPLNAAIYLSATPCMVLLINKFCFNDRITKANLFGVLLSSLGVIYLVMEGNLTNIKQLGHLNKGDLFAIGSAFSWAFYCAFLRVKHKKISSTVFVTITSCLGAIILLPILAFNHPTAALSLMKINLSSMLGLAYLVIFPSWLAYLFWSKGIGVIGATEGEIYTHLVPLFGGLLSIGILKEPLNFYHFISALLIVLGIFLCSFRGKVKAAPPLVSLSREK